MASGVTPEAIFTKEVANMLSSVKFYFMRFLAVLLTAVLFLAPFQVFCVSSEDPFGKERTGFLFRKETVGNMSFIRKLPVCI